MYRRVFILVICSLKLQVIYSFNKISIVKVKEYNYSTYQVEIRTYFNEVSKIPILILFHIKNFIEHLKLKFDIGRKTYSSILAWLCDRIFIFVQLGIALGPSVIGNHSLTKSDRSIDMEGVDLKKSIIGW